MKSISRFDFSPEAGLLDSGLCDLWDEDRRSMLDRQPDAAEDPGGQERRQQVADKG